MSQPFVIEPHAPRAGFYRCLFNGATTQLLSTLRSTVGALTTGGVWIVPFDRIVHVADAAKACGYTPQGGVYKIEEQEIKVPKEVYPHQIRGISRGLEQRRIMLNFKPGLGKTATALLTMKTAGVARALIVCPAIVRDTWAQQFAMWWPKAMHEVQIVETGKEAVAANAPFVVVSYELMSKVAHQDWNAVVMDECHYLKTAGSKRAKEAAMVTDWRRLSNDALRLWLTGTPIANEPIDLHNQVELLYPSLWGSIHDFKRRYCLSRDNPRAYSGKEYYGVNPRFAVELRERLDAVSVTATEDEVASLIEKPTFEPIRVRPSRAFNIREYLANFDRRDSHNAKSGDAIRACGIAKIEHVLALVRNDLAGGSTHIAVMTHLKATAYEIADALAGEGVPVVCITGKDDHKKRHAEIARAVKEKHAIFVATMHCVSTGINELKDFPDVIYAELDYRPDEVVQSMKRFPRIGSKARTRFRVLILEGTLEERVAKSVGRKLRDQKMISDVGTLAGDLEGALDERISDEEFYTRIQEAAAKMTTRDVYA